MWQRLRGLSERRRWGLVVALVLLALAAFNLWWVATYRSGFPFDVDEYGYTTIAFVDYIGLKVGGISEWWQMVLQQAPNAPLLTALTSLALVVKTGTLTGFGVLTGFLVLLGMASYGTAERLAGPRLGALAAVVTVTLPGAFVFSREFIFAMPTAAMLACAVYFLICSDGLRRRRWAIACGAALGLMLLSRTMSVAFVPGVLAAALLCLATRRQGDLGARLLNLGLLVLSGAAVAATWYTRNLQGVLDYLTSYGYGAQSKYYGKGNSLLSWERLRSPSIHMTAEDLLVPFAAILLLGLLVLAAVGIARVFRSEDRREALIRIASSDALSVAIVIVAGYVALTSSQNGGNGFTFPISALIPSLAVVALRIFPKAVVPAVSVIAVVAGFNVLSNTNLSAEASRARGVEVPGFGSLPYTNGVPHAVGAIRVQVPGSEAEFDERDRGWQVVDGEVVELLLRWAAPDGELPYTLFASRHRAISSNSVQQAAVIKYHTLFPIGGLDPEKPGDSVAAYYHQLTDPALGLPKVLITTSTNAGDFEPTITQAFAERAARRAGFRLGHTIPLPDGRTMRFWRREGS